MKTLTQLQQAELDKQDLSLSLEDDQEDSFDEADQDCLEEDGEYKGALKITKIKNRRYIRMPNFAKRSVNILKNWLHLHLDNPYPTHKEKETLSQESGLSKRQIQNWFTNARKVRELKKRKMENKLLNKGCTHSPNIL